MDDEFWSPKRKVWREVTIRDCFQKFENDRGGALNNFDKVRDGLRGGHAGPPWYDGLIYEMIRGASDFLATQPDPELDRQLDGYIARIAAAAAKDPNGYLNTYTQLDEPTHRWGLNGGLQLWQHEVYNAGALVEAGVHHYKATGKTSLLAVGLKFANHMAEVMGPPPKKAIVPCHPLPEEALVKLYELFRDDPGLEQKVPLPVDKAAYLRLAEFWIDDRGHNIGKPDWEKDWHAAEEFIRNQEYGDGRPSWGAYAQDDKPVVEQMDIHGHAVRATLLCAGLSAAARVDHREDYSQTALRLWENMAFRRMHITGGVGAFAQEEKFGADYALPNDAYLETCAAVGAGFFHQNMNMLFGEARYVDELERALYNGALAGVSLKGDTYFYQNPLEAGPDRTRWVWHDCPCCPPMFLKLMGAMPGYIYATENDSVYVNLFVGSRASVSLPQTKVEVRQATRYPWDGSVRIFVQAVQPTAFNLMVRIPGWCPDATLKVNGQALTNPERVRGYARIQRRWQSGESVELNMPMPVQAVRAHPLVLADAGKIALLRGPVVYCLESADNGDQVRSFAVRPQGPFSTQHRQELLGGLTVVKGNASTLDSQRWDNSLYRVATDVSPLKETGFTAIPYYANANRGPVSMTVWVPAAL
ncbi:MAG: glycoside hydrolase family 127 protein [Acidobacteriia bacterium]|nr:glycoside hydrolase family 127 protein [Terriglobia bacterium]